MRAEGIAAGQSNGRRSATAGCRRRAFAKRRGTRAAWRGTPPPWRCDQAKALGSLRLRARFLGGQRVAANGAARVVAAPGNRERLRTRRAAAGPAVPALRATADNETGLHDFPAGTAQVQQETTMGIATKQHLVHRKLSFLTWHQPRVLPMGVGVGVTGRAGDTASGRECQFPRNTYTRVRSGYVPVILLRGRLCQTSS